jgi:hypothetical protein
MGVYWGMRLLDEVPAPSDSARRRRLRSQTLLYAAPYGDVKRHMQLLSQGGEFITHLWALLYHIGIDGWELEPAAEASEVDAGETSQHEAAATGLTTSQGQVEGDDY